VLELDARCELQRDTHASERVVSLLAPALALVAVLEDGSVLRAPPVGSFQRVARLGGRVSSAAVRGDELLAVVDQHALVAVPLTGGTPRTLASEGSLALVGAPAVLANGGSVLCTEDDLLSVRAQDGHETLRIPLAVSRGLQRPRPPQVLADPRAQLLVVQATREALSVSPDGKLATVEGATCSEPFAPVPLGNGRVAIACRSGQLFFLADNP
jgi:hypothetical protein